MHQWRSTATNAEAKARDILSAAMWLHSAFQERVWLWRGQADGRFGIEPALHTRVMASSFSKDEATALAATKALITSARSLKLDERENNILPDLALLANLQHHGAATPLLDVSTDPLIALWMVAFADARQPDGLDERHGALFGIARPPKSRWVEPLDARAYDQISKTYGNEILWYRAPDVTERLRIQRGSFLLGPLSDKNERKESTLPLEFASEGANFISTRIKNRGKKGNGHLGDIRAFRIVIPAATKKHLRKLLEDRSGLSIETIYPTPWHQPFVTQFSTAYGRSRPLDLDLPPSTSPMLSSSTGSQDS